MPALSLPALSLPESVLACVLRFTLRPVLGPPFPVWAQRFWMTFFSLLSQPPRGIARQRISLGGADSVMFAPARVPATGRPQTPVVLYLHGGAFVTGNQHTHASIAGYLARELGSAVHVLLYRRAPEYPYPAGRNDALNAYQALIELGTDPSQIIVVGDSAGGAMVADLLFDIALAGHARPAGGVLLSPVTGFAGERPAGAGSKDTLVRRSWVDTSVAAYQRGTQDAAHRILGRDRALLAQLPPIYLQYSEGELLMAEGRQFGQELAAAGVPVEVHADAGAFHVLALLPGMMRRARFSLHDIAVFARGCVAATGASGSRSA